MTFQLLIYTSISLFKIDISFGHKMSRIGEIAVLVYNLKALIKGYLIPANFTDIKDLTIHDNIIYMAGGFQGTLAFETSFSTPFT